MEKKDLVVAILLLFIVVKTSYAVPNHFLPAGGTQEVVQLSFLGQGLNSGWYFGVYDWGKDPSDSNRLILLDSNTTSGEFKVEVDKVNGGYQITVTEGVDKDESLNIGNSMDFAFFFYNGTEYFDPTIEENSDRANSYYFYYNDQCVQGNDMTAVPNPQSFILLFSGLLGLIIIRGKKKI